MGKFAEGTQVRVVADVPDSVQTFIGSEGVIFGEHPTYGWNLVQFEHAQLGFRDEELEPVLEEHQLVSREELEERFVRQRNTIQSLQEKVAEYEQVIQYTEDQLDEEDARRNRTHFMVFKGLPRGGKFKLLQDAEELAGNLADRDHGNYTVVTVEDFEDGNPPIMVAEYVGVRLNVLEAVQYNDEED